MHKFATTILIDPLSSVFFPHSTIWANIGSTLLSNVERVILSFYIHYPQNHRSNNNQGLSWR